MDYNKGEEARPDGSADKAVCKLKLPPPAASASASGKQTLLDVWMSLGFAEGSPVGKTEVPSHEREYSQLRRAMQEHIECSRGGSQGQLLHYNSWFDLLGHGWNQVPYAHSMNSDSCTERMRAINRNLTQRGAPAMDAFLLDDGWDDWDTLWEVAAKRFPRAFEPLLKEGSATGTSMGLWMSPFGGYAEAGARRLSIGDRLGLERHPGRGFDLSGERYFKRFKSVAVRRLEEGFRMFKFDGIGGGLGQSGAGSFIGDFEAMLRLIGELRQVAQSLDDAAVAVSTPERKKRRTLWINLTIGTWPSIFWLLWADSIWRDGIDVGLEGEGSKREQWLTFRDASLLRALRRGPSFPLPMLMQHGLVWSRVGMARDLWDENAEPTAEDFRKEALTFFLSGVCLQELYLQLELMRPIYWQYLAEMSSFARVHKEVLKDAHWIGGDPGRGEVYGVASFGHMPGTSRLKNEGVQQEGVIAAGSLKDSGNASLGLLYWRNPSGKPGKVQFRVADVLELSQRWLRLPAPCWLISDLQLETAKDASDVRPLRLRLNNYGGRDSSSDSAVVSSAFQILSLSLNAFQVQALSLRPASC
eukprot:TRINITY_DN9360_c5_g1_i1.p1 TRINITY_DN9360_c5_g1~~TRINITY_DN9360_c5_g1_i1.p1  ORF type:complete len:594 (+),score=117.24 TRINITY_DN9360_c5_g1_i1:28-1782(+)